MNNRGKWLPKQAELDRWGPELQKNCKKTFLKNSRVHAHLPLFPEVQLELPVSNLNSRGTGGGSWGLEQFTGALWEARDGRRRGGESSREYRNGTKSCGLGKFPCSLVEYFILRLSLKSGWVFSAGPWLFPAGDSPQSHLVLVPTLTKCVVIRGNDFKLKKGEVRLD